jgi:hypothetical protein
LTGSKGEGGSVELCEGPPSRMGVSARSWSIGSGFVDRGVAEAAAAEPPLSPVRATRVVV